MAKVSFTKIENAWGEALRKISIEHLKELATIANLLTQSKATVSSAIIQQIVKRFQKELKHLKKYDPKLYQRLEMDTQDEERFLNSKLDLTKEDWLKFKMIKEKIEVLKKELYGEAVTRTEDEKQIELQRIKHINKRFNVRDGWLPLK